jgi:pimeloyl-ACP methyl ester carboxylesterase
MAGSSSFFTGSGGWKLHLESWEAKKPVKACVLFLHGVNESSQTLTARRLASAFVSEGMSFFALEHHAHGLSLECNGQQCTMGLIDSFDLAVQHIREACCEVSSVHPGVPIILIGHSMGAALGACALKECQSTLQEKGTEILCAIFIAPPIGVAFPNFQIVRGILRALVAFWPSAPIGPPEHPAEYCPPDVDPPGRNYQGMMRAHTALSFLDFADGGFREKVGHGDWYDLPFAVVFGTNDGIISQEGCMELTSTGPCGEFMELENGSHQAIACDENWQDIVSKLVGWAQGKHSARKVHLKDMATCRPEVACHGLCK